MAREDDRMLVNRTKKERYHECVCLCVTSRLWPQQRRDIQFCVWVLDISQTPFPSLFVTIPLNEYKYSIQQEAKQYTRSTISF